jgi:tRNA1(Val) A37 N6-methylase TrmN6
VACFPQLSEMVSPFSSLIWSEMKVAELKVDHYVDLGCGVGSTLLLVSNTLRPQLSLGVEAQEQSACLLRRTLSELPDGAPNIDIIHKDLRDILKTDLLNNVIRENSNINGVKEELSGLIDSNNVGSNYELSGNCNLITANPPYAALQSGKYISCCTIV